MLLWAGSIGGAISLFVHFETVLKLSDLAQRLVAQWKGLTAAIWGWVFSWINVRPPIAVLPFLTLSAFFLLATVGAVARQRRAIADERSRHATLVLRTACLIAICGIVGLGSWEQLSTLDLIHGFGFGRQATWPPERSPVPFWLDILRVLLALNNLTLLVGSAAVLLLALLLAPSALLLGLLRARHRPSWTFLAYLLAMATLWVALVVDPSLAILGMGALAVLAAPVIIFRRRQAWDARDQFLYPLTSRLPYFVGMLLFLLLLNEISKLDLALYHSKIPS